MQTLLSSLNGQQNGREGTREIDLDTLRGVRVQFQIPYLVRPGTGENPSDLTEEDACLATGIPGLGDLVNNGYCIRKSAQEINDVEGIWLVTCDFDSNGVAASQVSRLGGNIFGTEEDTRYDLSWDSEFIEEALQHDPVTGEPIVNAVGEPVPIPVQLVIPILNIERIESNFDPDRILTYSNHTNSSDFYGAPRDCALMARIGATEVYVQGIRKWRVAYTIKFNFKVYYNTSILPPANQLIGWNFASLHQGTKYKPDPGLITPDDRIIADGDDAFLPFTDSNKNPTVGNLTLDGYKAAPGVNFYQLFHRYPRANFNLLNLPTPGWSPSTRDIYDP